MAFLMSDNSAKPHTGAPRAASAVMVGMSMATALKRVAHNHA